MKHFLYILIFSTVFSYSFSQSNKTYFDSSIEVDNYNVPINSSTFYFPTKLFPKVDMELKEDRKNSLIIIPKLIPNSIDSFDLKWFSEFLFAMKEPLLFNKKIKKEIFRFTWLRSFDQPIVIRIEKDSNNVALYWKITDGAGGYKPGSLIQNMNIDVTMNDWRQFIKLTKLLDFWNFQRKSSFGTDGAEWILEGVNDNKYYATSCWSPFENEEFYKTCIFLVKLTGIKIEKDKMY